MLFHEKTTQPKRTFYGHKHVTLSKKESKFKTTPKGIVTIKKWGCKKIANPQES